MWERLSPVWQACVEQAWRAYLLNSIPIGAVVTDAGGRILARGHNRIGVHAPEDGAVCGNPLAHAELNALVSLDYAAVADIHACALYTTTEPCPLCMGAFYMSGVRSLHYASRDPYAGSVNLLGTTPYLSRKPIRAFGPTDPGLERLMMVMYICQALDRYREAYGPVFDAMESVMPSCIDQGRLLASAGVMASLRQQAALAAAAMDALAEFLSL